MCEYGKGKESIICVTECIRENENIGKRETQCVSVCVYIRGEMFVCVHIEGEMKNPGI